MWILVIREPEARVATEESEATVPHDPSAA